MDNITTKDSSDKTSRSIGKIHMNPHWRPFGVSLRAFQQRINSFSWPCCPEGGVHGALGKEKTRIATPLALLTPSSLPTRVWALTGTICSHTKEKIALLWVPVCLTWLPDIGMICFLGCLELNTFLSGVNAFYRPKRPTRLQGINV